MVFRAKFRDGLQQLFDGGQLQFPRSEARLSDPVVFARWSILERKPIVWIFLAQLAQLCLERACKAA